MWRRSTPFIPRCTSGRVTTKPCPCSPRHAAAAVPALHRERLGGPGGPWRQPVTSSATSASSPRWPCPPTASNCTWAELGNLGVAIAIFNRAVDAPPLRGTRGASLSRARSPWHQPFSPAKWRLGPAFWLCAVRPGKHDLLGGDDGKVPAGYVPVVEHLTIAGNGGRGVWASDIMSPSCSGCTEVAYQVLLRSSGLVGHFLPNGPATAGTCWQHLSGGFGWQTGDVYFEPFNGIVYQPLRRSGGTVS